MLPASENANREQPSPSQQFLTTQGAQQLATATKTEPQMLGFTSRWFLKVLPWVNVPGGTYQVNSVFDDMAPRKPQSADIDKYGQPRIKVAIGEKDPLPSSGAQYTIKPRIHELTVARTILRIPTLVADIYNYTMNQTQEQIKLVVATLREEQEDAMINNPGFGLLPYVNNKNNIFSPKISNANNRTLDNFDKLITSIREPHFILAHPRAIGALGQASTAAGIYPQNIDMGGQMVPAWRGVPVLPCSKLRVDPKTNLTSVLAMRTGENNHGVTGLYQTGIPDEYEPGLNVRFMGINANDSNDPNPMILYLVSLYFSIAALTPDAIGAINDFNVGAE